GVRGPAQGPHIGAEGHAVPPERECAVLLLWPADGQAVPHAGCREEPAAGAGVPRLRDVQGDEVARGAARAPVAAAPRATARSARSRPTRGCPRPCTWAS